MRIMSRHSSLRRTIATAGACIALGVTAQPAFAEPPAPVDPGTRIVDSANVLNNESQLQNGVNEVANEHNITLYVVMVDASPSPPTHPVGSGISRRRTVSAPTTRFWPWPPTHDRPASTQTAAAP